MRMDERDRAKPKDFVGVWENNMQCRKVLLFISIALFAATLIGIVILGVLATRVLTTAGTKAKVGRMNPFRPLEEVDTCQLRAIKKFSS